MQSKDKWVSRGEKVTENHFYSKSTRLLFLARGCYFSASTLCLHYPFSLNQLSFSSHSSHPSRLILNATSSLKPSWLCQLWTLGTFRLTLEQRCVPVHLHSSSLSIVQHTNFVWMNDPSPLSSETVHRVVYLPLTWKGHKTWLSQSAALSLQCGSWDGW